MFANTKKKKPDIRCTYDMKDSKALTVNTQLTNQRFSARSPEYILPRTSSPHLSVLGPVLAYALDLSLRVNRLVKQ